MPFLRIGHTETVSPGFCFQTLIFQSLGQSCGQESAGVGGREAGRTGGGRWREERGLGDAAGGMAGESGQVIQGGQNNLVHVENVRVGVHQGNLGGAGLWRRQRAMRWQEIGGWDSCSDHRRYLALKLTSFGTQLQIMCAQTKMQPGLQVFSLKFFSLGIDLQRLLMFTPAAARGVHYTANS